MPYSAAAPVPLAAKVGAGLPRWRAKDNNGQLRTDSPRRANSPGGAATHSRLPPVRRRIQAGMRPKAGRTC